MCCGGISAFGDEGTIPPEWQSLDEAGLVDLGKQLYLKGDAGAAGRKLLIQYLRSDYSGDAVATKRLSVDAWHRLLFNVMRELTITERTQCANEIVGAYAPTRTALLAMAAEDVIKLAEIREYFLYDVGGRQMLADYVTACVAWQQVDLKYMGRMYTILFKDRAAGEAARRRIATHIAATHSLDDGRSYSFRECDILVRAAMELGDAATAQQWVQRGYDAAVGPEAAAGKVTERMLRDLQFLRHWTGAEVKGEASPELAQAVVQKAQAGEISANQKDQELRWLGRAVAAEAARQAVQAHLIDGTGSPHEGVSKLLAWAYQASGGLKTWRAFLESKAADTSLSADARARWLVARAYAQITIVEDTCPIQGMPWLDNALVLAESPELRVDILGRITQAYAAANRHDLAIAIVDSAAVQFEGTPSAGDVATLREKMVAANAEFLAEKGRVKKAARTHRLTAYRARLQKRLAVARAKGNFERVARLEAKLGLR